MSRERALRRTLARATGITLAVIMIAGIAGYALFKIQTPVSLENAVDRFRAGNDDIIAGTRSVTSHADQKTIQKNETRRAKKGPSVDGRATDSSPSTVAAPRVRAPDGTVVAVSDRKTVPFGVMPAEGVYSYVGRGQEGFNGVNRDFPSESHRLITHLDRDTWKEHHVFSEERASWTKLTANRKGRFVPYQRNLIVIGPYRRDTTVPIHPPLHAVLFPPRVGQTWSGEFKGRTRPEGEDYTGTYTVRMIGDEVWRVGGESVRVLGYETDAEFVGELSATLTVKYWFSPFLGVTVHEHYAIDAFVPPLRYQAQWNVKLTSLHPTT